MILAKRKVGLQAEIDNIKFIWVLRKMRAVLIKLIRDNLPGWDSMALRHTNIRYHVFKGVTWYTWINLVS